MSGEGQLPDGWAWTTLGHVADTSLGKMLDRAKSLDAEAVPYLRNSNVQWGRIDLEDVKQMRIPAGELESFALAPGDLLVCEGGEIGRAAIWRDSSRYMAFQKALHRVRPNNATTADYLRYLLEHLGGTGGFDRLSTGSTIKHLPQQQLRQLPVPLAPIAEQHRIVEALEDHLSRLDAASAYLARARRATTSLENARRYDLLRPWFATMKSLGTLLVSPLINGRSVPTDDDGFPVLRLTAIKHGALDLSARKGGLWNQQDAAPFLVKQGDFMVSRGNGSLRLVGRGALVVEAPDPVAFPDTMIRVRPNQRLIDAQFLAFVWDSPQVRRQIESAARTTAGIYKINQAILERLQIPVPPRSEQQRIVESATEELAVVDRLISNVELADRRARGLRRALLAQAFSGRLVPQDPADEQASALLARVEDERASLAATKAKPVRLTRTTPTKASPPKTTSTVPVGIQEELPL